VQWRLQLWRALPWHNAQDSIRDWLLGYHGLGAALKRECTLPKVQPTMVLLARMRLVDVAAYYLAQISLDPRLLNLVWDVRRRPLVLLCDLGWNVGALPDIFTGCGSILLNILLLELRLLGQELAVAFELLLLSSSKVLRLHQELVRIWMCWSEILSHLLLYFVALIPEKSLHVLLFHSFHLFKPLLLLLNLAELLRENILSMILPWLLVLRMHGVHPRDNTW